MYLSLQTHVQYAVRRAAAPQAGQEPDRRGGATVLLLHVELPALVPRRVRRAARPVDVGPVVVGAMHGHGVLREGPGTHEHLRPAARRARGERQVGLGPAGAARQRVRDRIPAGVRHLHGVLSSSNIRVNWLEVVYVEFDTL